MDYKSLISDCQSRSEEFRMMHNAEGVVHELHASAWTNYMWESRCKMLEERAEKAERERDEALEAICTHCGDFPCRKSDCPWWRGQKEK